jgi:hypothetical protein
MFTGLNKEGYAVSINNGQLIAALRGPAIYMIDGTVVELSHGLHQYTIILGASIYKKVVHSKSIVGYWWDKVNNIKLTPERRLECINDIKSSYVNNDGDLSFPNLAVEFNVRRQIEVYEQLEPIYKEEWEEWVPVPIEIIGSVTETGSDFIESSISLGQINYSDKGAFKVYSGQVAEDEFIKICQEKGLKYNLPDYGHLEFAKINEEYVWGNKPKNFIKFADDALICDPLEKAKECEKWIRNQVYNDLKTKFFPEKLTEFNTQKLLKEVKLLRSYLDGLKVIKAAYIGKRSCIALIGEIQTNLENALLNRENND